MGLHFIGALRIALFDSELRYQHAARPAGGIGAFMIGVAFAFGWTPCIGPVLATILAVAASEESVARGAGLLALYSAGLGLPFIAAAYGLQTFIGAFRHMRRHLAKVEMIMLGHLRYDRLDAKPMSLSKVAVRALQNDLGFSGVTVTDDLGMGALSNWDPIDKVSQAVDAGVDVMLYDSPPTGWAALVDHVNSMVSDGIVSRAEINRRVEKIVALKIKHFGLS